MVHTHTHPNQYVNIKILQSYGIKGYTDREVTVNRSDIVIKYKKEKTCILIYVWQYQWIEMSCKRKQKKKATKIQEMMYRDTTNVEHEKYDYTANN
jgi:hypothetical protein